jgi:putative addiction module killer protein
MSIAVVEYVREDGSNPFRRWFDRLDPQSAAKVTTATIRLGAGNTSNLKGLGTIAEYRIDWGPGYRIYLGRDGETFVLLGGGTKKNQGADSRRLAGRGRNTRSVKPRRGPK